MAERDIRLGSTLRFDADKEKDIIVLIEKLTSSRKLGDFIASMFRVLVDSPDDYKNRADLISAISEVNKCGIHPSRGEFFADAHKSLRDMASKVDEIHKMCMSLYTMAALGKRMGIECKAENIMVAEFVLKRQIQDIERALGVPSFTEIFESDKIQNSKEVAEEAVVYLLESYGGLFSTNIAEEATADKQAINQEAVRPTAAKLGTTAGPMKPMVENIEAKEAEFKGPIAAPTSDIGVGVKMIDGAKEDEEVVDFGDADLGALTQFFGPRG